jgi:pyruvate/2-oxoglutarate dehydrogenase complex dihydrolipoamide acyltransferase (E2) component
METGAIAEWLIKVGDKFEAGTAICEVNTDKATVPYEATEEGYIAKILIGVNEELKVGTFVSSYCL